MPCDHHDKSRDSRFFGLMARDETIGEAIAMVPSADLAHRLGPRFNRFFSKLD